MTGVTCLVPAASGRSSPPEALARDHHVELVIQAVSRIVRRVLVITGLVNFFRLCLHLHLHRGVVLTGSEAGPVDGGIYGQPLSDDPHATTGTHTVGGDAGQPERVARMGRFAGWNGGHSGQSAIGHHHRSGAGGQPA